MLKPFSSGVVLMYPPAVEKRYNLFDVAKSKQKEMNVNCSTRDVYALIYFEIYLLFVLTFSQHFVPLFSFLILYGLTIHKEGIRR